MEAHHHSHTVDPDNHRAGKNGRMISWSFLKDQKRSEKTVEAGY